MVVSPPAARAEPAQASRPETQWHRSKGSRWDRGPGRQLPCAHRPPLHTLNSAGGRVAAAS